MRRSKVALLGTAVLVAGSFSFAGSAGGSSASGGTAEGAVTAGSSSTTGPGSSNWLAGYQVSPSSGLASVSVTFKMPTADCSTDVSGNVYSVSFGVYTDDLADYAMAVAICLNTGPAEYGFQVKTPAGTFNEPGLNAGDTVLAYIAQTPASTIAVVRDLTTGAHWRSAYGADQAKKTIDIGAYEALRNGYEIPPFTTTKFTNAQVNGDYLKFEAPTRYNAYDPGNGHEVIASGSLTTGASGSSFSVTFLNSF